MHRLLRYSSLSFSIVAMAREVRLSAPATVLFVTIVMALIVPPSFHRDILPSSFPISSHILDLVLISHDDNQALAISVLVSQYGRGSWRACNVELDLMANPVAGKLLNLVSFVSNSVS
eukprot:g31270.t1